MAFLVYLLRAPIEVFPQSVIPPTDLNVLVLRIRTAAPASVPLCAAEVLRSGNGSSLKAGERLTYEQLFDVLNRAGKVIIL
jgi:hypothetical protein